MNNPFIFVDGWTFHASNGNKTKVLKKDIKDAKRKGMTEDGIKIMAYSYLIEPQNLYEDVNKNVYKQHEF